MYNYPFSQIPMPMQQQYPQQYQQYQPQYQQMRQQNITSGINGRVVNNANDIAVNEIPMDGNASFFPIAGEDVIVSKRWNANGTIETSVYRLDKGVADANANNPNGATLESIQSAFQTLQSGLYERIDELERRLGHVEPIERVESTKK